MKIRPLYIAFIAFFAVAAAGCNSDIFIDGPDVPDTQSATIDGNGGEASFTIPVKGLIKFSFDNVSESNSRYYNAAGEAIDPDSPASEVARIVRENDFLKIEILKKGSKLTIRSTCLTFHSEAHWSIRLEYTYGTRFIEFGVRPGKPLLLRDVVYGNGLKVYDRAHVTTRRYNVVNDAPLPMSVTIMPYLNELATILVEPERPYSWVGNYTLTLPVPVFTDGEWILAEKNGIRPDTKYSYEGPDRMTKTEVDVPAHAHVNIITDVTYTGAEASGYMLFHNEILDRQIIEKFKVRSLYPVSYEIRIEDAK